MSKEPLKILIVDNHPLFLESIAEILSSGDYEVQKAAGGLEAIDILETFKPQIFFIDLIMPYINGEKLSSFIRTRNEFRDAFIVILSGIARETEKVEIPPHADAFIAKGPMKLMAGHIFDVIDQYRSQKRYRHPENLLGIDEIAPRHITKELLFSVKHLEVLLDNMLEGIVEISRDNRIVYMNPAASDILQAGEFSLLSKDFVSVFLKEDAEKIASLLADFDAGKEVRDVVIRINYHFIRTTILRVADNSVETKIVFLNDVTSFKEKEEKLQKALAEKEMLLKEVHHRVKNNLNIISGLLGIQSTIMEDDAARDMLLEIQPRLQSISLVHDKLYNTEDLTNIDLGQYLEELARLLLGMMSGPEFSVDLSLDIPPLSLGTDLTVSLGLICTELITNAVKYGFYKENPEPNRLRIRLETVGEEKRLSICNNGHPFPEDLNIHESRKLGFQVINLLVKQINGTLLLERSGETKFTILFF